MQTIRTVSCRLINQRNNCNRERKTGFKLTLDRSLSMLVRPQLLGAGSLPSISSLPAADATPLLAPLPSPSSFVVPSASPPRGLWSNWAGTVRFAPSFFHAPSSVAEIQAVLAFARDRKHKVRVVGFGHSPGDIVDASPVPMGAGAAVPIHLLALAINFRALISVDVARKQATVQSGMSLEVLNSVLDAHGLALSTLGSISDQTIGGSMSCGTHGSSTRSHALLSAYCVAFELMDYSGKIWRCCADENKDLFDAGRVSLGCLGVLTSITVQCESAYDLLEQSVSIPFNDLVDPLKFSLMLRDAQSDFVRFHWIPHTESVVYTRMQKVFGRPELRASAVKEQEARASAAAAYLHRLAAWKDRLVGFHSLQTAYLLSRTSRGVGQWMVPAIATLYNKILNPPMVELQVESGPATAAGDVAISAADPSSPSLVLPRASASFTRRDRHDRILNFDCLFAQYVTEWAIDVHQVPRALRELREYIRTQDLQVHFPVEIRFSGGAGVVAAAAGSGSSAGPASSPDHGDGIWLSPCYSSPQAWIGLIMYRPFGHDVAFRQYFRGVEMLFNDTPIQSGTKATERAAMDVAEAKRKRDAAVTSAVAVAAFAPPASATRFNGKPHWAKNVVMPLELLDLPRLYPRWNDFREMRNKMDPEGMFENKYVQKLMGLGNAPEAAVVAPAAFLPSKL